MDLKKNCLLCGHCQFFWVPVDAQLTVAMPKLYIYIYVYGLLLSQKYNVGINLMKAPNSKFPFRAERWIWILNANEQSPWKRTRIYIMLSLFDSQSNTRLKYKLSHTHRQSIIQNQVTPGNSRRSLHSRVDRDSLHLQWFSRQDQFVCVDSRKKIMDGRRS